MGFQGFEECFYFFHQRRYLLTSMRLFTYFYRIGVGLKNFFGCQFFLLKFEFVTKAYKRIDVFYIIFRVHVLF